ncbi:hypothetical protein BDL97_17G015500 [Sphagnum fallax]|nr:hypothetical protein BDL97_17G015500 [Sphagnum fallax]
MELLLWSRSKSSSAHETHAPTIRGIATLQRCNFSFFSFSFFLFFFVFFFFSFFFRKEGNDNNAAVAFFFRSSSSSSSSRKKRRRQRQCLLLPLLSCSSAIVHRTFFFVFVLFEEASLQRCNFSSSFSFFFFLFFFLFSFFFFFFFFFRCKKFKCLHFTVCCIIDPLWLLYGFYVFEILQTCLGHVQDPEVEAEQSHNSIKTGITKTYRRKREASVQIFSCLFLWISWSCMKFSW